MDIIMPYYEIDYLPQRGLGGFGFDIKLPKDFPKIARELNIPKDCIEAFARDMFQVHRFDSEDYKNSTICNWEEMGLLHHVIVPGDAAGLVISLEDLYAPQYSSHNIDSPTQQSIALAIIVRYLKIVKEEFNRLRDN